MDACSKEAKLLLYMGEPVCDMTRERLIEVVVEFAEAEIRRDNPLDREAFSLGYIEQMRRGIR